MIWRAAATAFLLAVSAMIVAELRDGRPFALSDWPILTVAGFALLTFALLIAGVWLS